MTNAKGKSAQGIAIMSKAVSGQVFHLGRSKISDFIKNGAQLTQCQLVLHDPTAVSLYRALFKECLVEAKSVSRASWIGCKWQHCTFRGSFHSCVFGARSDDDTTSELMLDTCNFLEGDLHHCSFMNCSPNSIRFPIWPYFTVLFPRENAVSWLTLPFVQQSHLLRAFGENSGNEVCATTYHWPTCQTDSGLTIPSDEVLKVFKGLDYIRLS